VDVKKGYNSIPSHLTGPIAGGLQSFAGLLSKINENDKKVSDRVNTLEREQSVLKWAMALAVGALISVGLRDCSFTRQSDQTKAGISAPASPTPAARTP
jgi:dCTP deaminase